MEAKKMSILLVLLTHCFTAHGSSLFTEETLDSQTYLTQTIQTEISTPPAQTPAPTTTTTIPAPTTTTTTPAPTTTTTTPAPTTTTTTPAPTPAPTTTTTTPAPTPAPTATPAPSQPSSQTPTAAPSQSSSLSTTPTLGDSTTFLCNVSNCMSCVDHVSSRCAKCSDGFLKFNYTCFDETACNATMCVMCHESDTSNCTQCADEYTLNDMNVCEMVGDTGAMTSFSYWIFFCVTFTLIIQGKGDEVI